MKIRSHLLILVLASVLPIVAFSAIMTIVFWREQRHAFEQRYLDRVRAMAIALDREIDGTIRSLQVLSESPYLKSGDLPSFYEQAQRTLSMQTTWANIILVDAAAARQIINLRRPFGAPLPAVDRQSLEVVLKSGRPFVPPLGKGPVSGQWATRVIVPVKSDGPYRYALVAVFDQPSWLRFLSSYPIASDATMTLLDQNGIVIARTLNPERWIGRPASPVLYAESRKSPEGAYINRGLEGQWFYTGHSRSKISGWTVATGVPKKGVEAALRQSTILMILGAAATAILAIILAIVFGRRISQPVSHLARSAHALATGEHLNSGEPSGVAEVAEVRQAFYESAQKLRAQESVLRENEERLRLAMQTGKVGVWDWNVVTNRVLWTESLYTIHGVKPDEFDPRVEGFAALLHPEDRDSVLQALQRTLENDEPYELEFRAIRPDGNIVWLFTNAFVLRDGGKPIRMLGATMDITQRKLAEETIRKLLQISEKLNSTLDVDTLLDLLVNEATQIVDAESGVSGLYTPEGMVCRKYFFKGNSVPLECCWPSMQGLPGWLIVHKVPYLTNAIDKDPQIDREFYARFGVGSALSTPILNVQREVIGFFEIHNKRDAGGFTDSDRRTLMAIAEAAAIAIQNDMAYRKLQQTEESLREADRRKDEYLAMLGHELRNPLGVISTAVQLFRTKAATIPELQELRDIVEHQVEHMARLMDDLLDVSRISRGQMRLNKEICDFAAIVREIVEDYRATLEENGLQLNLHLPQTPLWVLGDRTRLTQAVSNLIHNASKFTDSGAVVTVDVHEAAASKEVMLTVRDTGIGMEPEVLARLFEPFSQGYYGVDRSRGGLGLGLTLVKGLIELHGGEVRAFSDGPGHGSELTIRLPLQDGPAPDVKGAVPSAMSSRSCRVLLIEDNRLAVRTMKMFLTQKGHTVEVALTGLEGIKAAERFQPDVVLCDIGLPGCDGYMVAQRLRQEARLTGVYLIAISGYGQENDKQRAWDAGFDSYLVKPVNLTELETMLSEFSESEKLGVMQ